MSIRNVTVTPAFMQVRRNVEALQELFSENGQWLVTIHNRCIVELSHIPAEDVEQEHPGKEDNPDHQDLTTS